MLHQRRDLRGLPPVDDLDAPSPFTVGVKPAHAYCILSIEYFLLVLRRISWTVRSEMQQPLAAVEETQNAAEGIDVPR